MRLARVVLHDRPSDRLIARQVDTPMIGFGAQPTQDDAPSKGPF